MLWGLSLAAAQTTFSRSTHPLLMSYVDEPNILPGFLFQQGAVEGGSTSVPIGGGIGKVLPFIPTDRCGDDIWNTTSPDLRAPQLPYLTQDVWGCERTTASIPTIKMVGAGVESHITPQWGGRMWTINSTKGGVSRPLVFNNPAHQPANIAVLKAWTAGGMEWNWSPGVIGHSVFSESPVFAGIVPAPAGSGFGDLLRVWEFDRRNHTVWGVTIGADQDGVVWFHPHVSNPTDAYTPGYWWSCGAHHVTPMSRVIVPAKSSAQTSAGVCDCSPWPLLDSGFLNASFAGLNGTRIQDNSVLANIPGGDFFMREMDPSVPAYIAHAAPDGWVQAHGHSDWLAGTKFFTWGQSGPGRFMQDFLAGGSPADRAGDYAELQVGPAPTQMNQFALNAKQTLRWTEWLSGFEADPGRLYSPDYATARKAVEEKIVPNSRLQAVHQMFVDVSSTAPSSLLFSGSPWGGLEVLRTGAAFLSPGVFFPTPERTPETAPWLDLLGAAGTFSAEVLGREPTSWLVHPAWLKLVEDSAAAHGATWLHLLFSAVARIEAGEVIGPRVSLTQALRLRNSPLAHRCLAVIASSRAAAAGHFWDAWAAAVALPTSDAARPRILDALAREMANFFRSGGLMESGSLAQHFLNVSTAAPSSLGRDALLVAAIQLDLWGGKPDPALGVLSRECFPTMGSERQWLMDAWEAGVEMRAEIAAGRRLLPQELRAVRLANPVPRNIGCAYATSYCDNYW